MWRSMPPLADALACRNAAAAHYTRTDNWNLDDIDITCPTCGSKRMVTGTALRIKSGYAQIVCKHCKDKPISKHWKCPCNIPWHRCDKHAELFQHVAFTHQRHRTYARHVAAAKKRA